MLDDAASIAPDEATPWMRAVERASAIAWDALDVDIIRRFKDPWQCPAHLLWALAAERSVDIWNDNWPEWKKRSVIASAPHDHAIKTTASGIARYIEIADGRLIQAVTPPQGFVLAPNLTKEQWDAWIGRMPRVRITLAHTEGEWLPPSGIFLGHSALGDDFFSINDGPFLHGRRALLRTHAGGEDVPLEVSSVTTTSVRKPATDYERVVQPGRDANALVLGFGVLGDAFLGAEEVEPKIFTFALDRTYDHVESQLAVTAVDVGLEPQSVRYKRESDTGDAEGRHFLGDGALGVDVLGRNDGGELLADVLYLLDPAVAAPIVDGISFLGVSRLGMPAYNAELMVEAPKAIDTNEGFVLGVSVLGADPFVADDVSHLHFIMDAIVSAMALGDKILVTFETTKPLTLGDAVRLNSGAVLGDRIPAYL